MIDLHNHLLPGIDDGAPDLDTALQLARMAVADGITHMVCTPHIHPGRYDNNPQSIQPALQRLQQGLQAAGIPLQIAAAAEVRFGVELMADVTSGSIPFLGRWQEQPVLLLEFPHGDIPFGAEKLTQWLRQRGIAVMIAHPERNKALMHTPARLRPFLDQGCLLQVTAGSVSGRFGAAAQKLAHSLLEQQLVTILATDAHNREHRPPLLREGMQHASQLIGERAATQLVIDNPWQIASSHFS